MADMSIVLFGAPDQESEVDGPFYLTNGPGWSHACRWVGSSAAEEFSHLRALAEHGSIKGTDVLGVELAGAAILADDCTSGVLQELAEYVGVGDPDETIVLTDGESGDETKAVGSESEAGPPAEKAGTFHDEEATLGNHDGDLFSPIEAALPRRPRTLAEFRDLYAAPCAESEPDGLLDLPNIRQRDFFSCGASAAMAVGRWFGVGPQTLDEWKKALGTTEETSTRPEAIVDYLRSLGLDVEDCQGLTIEDLRQSWLSRRPVICCIQEFGAADEPTSHEFGHWVTSIGVALGMVFVQCSSEDNVLQQEKHPDTEGAPEELLSLAAEFLDLSP